MHDPVRSASHSSTDDSASVTTRAHCRSAERAFHKTVLRLTTVQQRCPHLAAVASEPEQWQKSQSAASANARVSLAQTRTQAGSQRVVTLPDRLDKAAEPVRKLSHLLADTSGSSCACTQRPASPPELGQQPGHNKEDPVACGSFTHLPVKPPRRSKSKHGLPRRYQ